jgi:1-acyl-sn-glycerol-3-phosphate acyltransferase
MTAHQLARRLLELPNLPVATSALGNIYFSVDRLAQGDLWLGRMHHYAGPHLVIGSFVNDNKPNWYLTERFSLEGSR